MGSLACNEGVESCFSRSSFICVVFRVVESKVFFGYLITGVFECVFSIRTILFGFFRRERGRVYRFIL